MNKRASRTTAGFIPKHPMTTLGFTIVELLIVIVVIAILAAISIVAYSGIQQRANNTAIIQAAQQTLKLIKASNVANGTTYPYNNSVCVTTDNSCTAWNGVVSTVSNATILNALKTVGTPVSSITHPSGMDYYGIYYNYRSTMTYNNSSAYGLLMYWLVGNQQDCVLGDVAQQVASDGSHPDPWITSTVKWSSSGSGRTTCYVALYS